MIYSFPILALKNTTALTKQRTDINLKKGVIHKVEIQFPIGCAELAHMQIYDNLSQLWPSNEGQSFASDGHVIAIKDSHVIDTAPFSLIVYVWNESEDYDHRITLRLGMLPKSALLEYVLPVTTYFLFKGGVT
jgi:hypothetical protein